MYIEKAVFVAIFLVAAFSATAWIFAHLRANKISTLCEGLQLEDAKLKFTISRLNKDIDTNKAKLAERDTLLTQIGGALDHVENPLVSLRLIYEILEKENVAFVMNSPLAFVNKQGKNAFSRNKDDGDVFQRIKKSMNS